MTTLTRFRSLAESLNSPQSKRRDTMAGVLYEARREVAAILAEMEWRDISTRPEIDHQPGRQFILLEGSCRHSEANWYRQWAGEAFIRKPGQPDEMLQYRLGDILRLCNDGDIDPHTAKVTHWMPARFAPYPSAPLPEPPALAVKTDGDRNE